jgi:hypothetical protein
MRALTLGMAAALALAGAAQGQALRHPDGAPDLEGAWSNATLTPLQRPPALGERRTLSPAEIAKIEGDEAAARAEGDRPIDPKATRIEGPNYKLPGIDGAAYDLAFIDPGWTVMRVGGEARSSLITTPTGRPPAVKAGARLATPGRGESIFSDFPGKNDNPENRSLGERCIIGFGRTGGPPMLPGLYNNTYQIVQGRDSVAINIEMVHDTRIVRLGAGEKHPPADVRPWFGDSIGRYEGQTLVVETTNLPKAQAFQGAWETLKVTERFTRVGKDRLLYQFQVEDPGVWATPWGGEYEFGTAAGKVYEYACHEGNYGLMNILAGARTEDGTLAARVAGRR